MPDQLDALHERIAALEVDLAMLRASLEEHHRTRRLAVVDDHGTERLVLEARHGTGSVLVRVPGPEGATTGIEVFATDAETGPAELGWCVLRDGDVVSRWTVG